MVFQNDELPSKFLGFGSSFGPQHDTSIAEQRNGYETRGQGWAQPRRHFDVNNDAITDANFRELQEFVIAREGSLNSFPITDPMDFTTHFTDVEPPSLEDERVGTGDGTNKIFFAMKRYADGISNQYEYERRLFKTATMVVGLDGVGQFDPADYVADQSLGKITFNSAPSRGQAITIGASFFTVVRFKIDLDDWLKNSLDEFNAGSLSLPMIEEKNPDQTFDRKQHDPGKVHSATSGAVQITFREGYRHFVSLASAMEVRLPDISNFSGEPSHFADGISTEGGPYFSVFNLGTFDITLKSLDASGAGWTAIADNSVIIPGTTRKIWIDFNSNWRAY